MELTGIVEFLLMFFAIKQVVHLNADKRKI